MNDIAKNPLSYIFRYLSISMVFMFIGFFIGQQFIPEGFVLYANILVYVFIFVFILLAFLTKKSRIPRSFSMNYVYLFTFIDGILMYPILEYYIQDLGKDVFLSVLAGTIVLFLVLSIISNKKKAGSYLGLTKILFSGLIGLLIVSVMGFFIFSETLYVLVSVGGVIIFTGYVLYDVNLVKLEIENGNINSKDDLSIHILNLYLDFINILLDLLNITSFFND